MDYGPIFSFFANAIYAALGLVALFGAWLVIFLLRRISQKRFSSPAAAGQFMDEVRNHLAKQDYDGLGQLCDSPPYWRKAVPNMMLVGLINRHRPINKLRRLLGERFEREILAELEYSSSWINTIVKSAPMLGLLGTVSGMIQAFSKIADAQQTGGDPSALAGEISFALFTTALGLTVAIPLTLAGAAIQVRIGKLQDSVQEMLGEFLDELDAIEVARSGGRG